MTLVVDATVVVAALVDSGPAGAWSETVLVSDALAAPHLMPVEVANILGRAEMAGDVTTEVATLADGDLRRLRVDLLPYEPVAARAWELRFNVTMYDAWYVALAESLDAPLATLDARLGRSPGPRCDFLLPS
jgi:predicted nucleic acid-binding protein